MTFEEFLIEKANEKGEINLLDEQGKIIGFTTISALKEVFGNDLSVEDMLAKSANNKWGIWRTCISQWQKEFKRP